ncbi:Ste13p Ecym_8323 [Eremothecium cymbalariae DBVPG|uniref:Dipeptidyl aminopeptidase A n=1 Tax=Eremothecium cymbalariae (strain CBS 270.75 / DBVPG 7215 / KCTC 17166 / NRRL Y-17582) TaxID=931890 RepID=G8JXM7_ERECY|nr:Hypothetical protein Ecym_8323 [Eremothecium cymbalariae DBVPG\
MGSWMVKLQEEEDFELHSVEVVNGSLDNGDPEAQLLSSSSIRSDKFDKFKSLLFSESISVSIWRWVLMIIGGALIWFGLLAWFEVHRSSLVAASPRDRSFSIENVFNREFTYQDETFRFLVPPAVLNLEYDSDEGRYLGVSSESGDMEFVIKKLSNTTYSKTLASMHFDYKQHSYEITTIEVSYESDRIIFGTDLVDEFRYSSRGHYWIKEVDSGKVYPISPDPGNTDLVKVSYCDFSPNYNYAYFVHENDLYVQNLYQPDSVRRITSDGAHDIYNGKPDWVYEEEVLASHKAVWWSPSESVLVFAKFNDSTVANYTMLKFISDEHYPNIEQIHYPNPGQSNPLVSMILYNLADNSSFEINVEEDGPFILYDALWLTDDLFMFKVTDRESRIMRVKIYDLHTGSCKTVRTIDSNSYGGWIEKVKKIFLIPPNKNQGRESLGYVDTVVDPEGFPHIFFFDSPYSEQGVQLTRGDWEVTSGPIAFDYDNATVYFMANKMHSMSQQLYAVSLNLPNDDNIHSVQNGVQAFDYFEFIFSGSTRFSIMQYLGPNIPVTKVGPIKALLEGDDLNTDVSQITHNQELSDALGKYDLPKSSYKLFTTSDNVSISYIETRPARMDPNRKYPLLVTVYGGPGSRTFTTEFRVLLEQSIVSGLDAIVLQIEPRGTGGKGWEFKSWLKDKIGFWEPRDITEITKTYISENYGHIDPERVAIWGWSYGGFTTLKTLEHDGGETFKYGIAVAPVTNWSSYDSIYTERYLRSPSTNLDGYSKHAAVVDLEPFLRVKRFMLAHGTADDNVHVVNTYKFLDRLNLGNIRNYDIHVFPDSNHSIMFHNAANTIYKTIYYWLDNAFNGKFDHLSN